MKILLIGYYGGINFGDEALVQVITTKFKEIDQSIEIALLTLNEEYTKVIHNLDGFLYKGINTIRKPISKRLLSAIRGSDIVMIGGGGVLHDMKHRLSMTFYLFPVILAKILGKPIAFFSIAVDPPIYSPWNKLLLRITSNLADHISVRDKLSQEYLDRIGIEREVYLTSDPVLMLDPELTEIEIICNKEHISPSRVIGVNVRAWGNISGEIVNKLTCILHYFIHNQYQIVFLCSPNDLEISKEIINKLDNNCCLILTTRYRPSLILGILSKFDLILTMRLHFAVSAVVVNTPCVVIPYLHKVKDFAQSFSLAEIDIKSESNDNIIRTLKDTMNSAPQTRQLLYQHQQCVFKDLKSVLDLRNKTVRVKERIKAFYSLCLLLAEVSWYILPLNKKKASQDYS